MLDRRDKLLQEALIKLLKKGGTPTKKAIQLALQLRHFYIGKQEPKPNLPSSRQIEKIKSMLPEIQRNALIKALVDIGLPKKSAEQLTEFSSIKGRPEEFLKSMENFRLNKTALTALEPLRELAKHLRDLGIEEICRFDASVARGLDYYTGIVFEAWDQSSGIPRAIAGGGRYDDLVGIFEGQRLPGTGFGFGETVILELAEEKGLLPSPNPPADLYLASVSTNQLTTCRQIATRLRNAGIRTLFNGFSWSLTKQLDDASKRQIPFAAIVGPRELEKDSVNVRDMETGIEQEVKIDEIAKFIQKALRKKANQR